MFYFIYNFLLNLSFIYALSFFTLALIIIFAVSTIINLKKIKNIEQLKPVRIKDKYFVILLFCSFSFLIQNAKVNLILGGVSFLLCVSLVENFLQSYIQKKALKKQNKVEEKNNYFEKNESIIQKSKKILSTIKTSTEEACRQEQKKANENCVNFSHVKSVLNKLKSYSLSPTEKRQVEELSYSMYSIENGEESEQEKQKLNDGLNSLLKIMAKYSV